MFSLDLSALDQIAQYTQEMRDILDKAFNNGTPLESVTLEPLQWEYTLFFFNPTDERNMSTLQELGADGWELCAYDHGVVVMKRVK